MLELPAEADLAAVALRLARGAGLCQVAASLREEMAFHEPRFCFCMELCPGRLGQPEVVLIILPSSLTWSPPAPLGVCVGRLCPVALLSSWCAQEVPGKRLGCSMLPQAPPRALGLCTGKAPGVLVPQGARAVCRASVWGQELG